MSKRIKDTYQKHLWLFISANAAIFWIILLKGVFNLQTLNEKFEISFDPKSILFILSPLLSLVFSGLLSNAIKEFLVFWRLHNRLPGCRAFSYFATHDHRIDIRNLRNYVGEFPKEPTEQNRKWYSLYKENDNDEVIIGSHKDFLLTRDLCSISFVFLVILWPIALAFFSSNSIKVAYSIFLIIQFLILSVTARNFGNRFVCNVLTIASKRKI